MRPTHPRAVPRICSPSTHPHAHLAPKMQRRALDMTAATHGRQPRLRGGALLRPARQFLKHLHRLWARISATCANKHCSAARRIDSSSMSQKSVCPLTTRRSSHPQDWLTGHSRKPRPHLMRCDSRCPHGLRSVGISTKTGLPASGSLDDGSASCRDTRILTQ